MKPAGNFRRSRSTPFVLPVKQRNNESPAALSSKSYKCKYYLINNMY